MNTSAAKLLEMLKKLDVPEEDIATLVAEIMQASVIRVMMKLMIVLTEDQVANLEKAKGTPAEQALVDAYCQIALGKSLQEELESVQEEMAAVYVKELKNQEEDESPVITSTPSRTSAPSSSMIHEDEKTPSRFTPAYDVLHAVRARRGALTN